MDTVEKYTLDVLTQDSVSIKKQQYASINGQEYALGEPWRRAYINSTKGRQILEAEVSEPYRSAILSVWGNTPTVADKT